MVFILFYGRNGMDIPGDGRKVGEGGKDTRMIVFFSFFCFFVEWMIWLTFLDVYAAHGIDETTWN